MTTSIRQRIAAVALVLITSASEAAVAAPPPDLKQIVVLYWYGKDFPSNVAFERGLQSALRAAAPGRAEYFPEFLESNRFPGDEQSEVLHDYLLRKYADRQIDAVVALSSTALEFLRRYRSDLFRGVPIVFHTFGMPDLNDPALRSRTTGVIADRVFRKTVDAALALHPGTREVLVVVGTPERDKKLEGDVRAELGDLERRVAIQYLSDLPLSDLMNRIKSAPPQSLVFCVRQSYDEPGNTLDPFDMLALVAGWSPVPVYSLAGSTLGRGTVGGYVTDVEAAGAMAGRIALKIADGARPSEIPIGTIQSAAAFDARQLTRWGIREDRLPAGSTVMFREPSLLRDYRKYVFGAVSIFGVQLALIGGLLVQRIRRRRAEESLRRSEARYRNVIDTQTELICRFLPDATLTFVNEAYCRFWHRTRRDLIGTSFLEVIPADARDTVRERIAALTGAGTLSDEHPVRLLDGGTGWQHWIHRAIVDDDGRVIELQGAGRDITEQRRVADRNRDLAGRLIASQEVERQRIARELHDDLSQRVALMSIEIDQLARVESEGERAARFRVLAERVAEFATDVHQLSHDLHPAKLQTLGLFAGLKALCRDVEHQHHLRVDFKYADLPRTIHPDVSLCLYRITQETLHNIVRHSGAQRAVVHLERDGDQLILKVIDHGVGFQPRDGSSGLGLVSIRERAAYIGGEVTIDASPGAGTCIRVHVPVDPGPRASLSHAQSA